MDMSKIKEFTTKHWRYIVIALIAFVIGIASGPSSDELDAVIEKADSAKINLKEVKEANTVLTKEKDELASKKEELLAKVNEAETWFKMTDEQKEQAKAKVQAEEQAKKEAEEKAKSEEETKPKAEEEA